MYDPCPICKKSLKELHVMFLEDGRLVCGPSCWKACNCILCQDDGAFIGIDQDYCEKGSKLDKPVGEKIVIEEACKDCIYWVAVINSAAETATCSIKEKSTNRDSTCKSFVKADRMESLADLISHPPHYTGITIKGVQIECIDVIEALDLDYHLGNALKYIWRAGRKTDDPQEDLKKAVWYVKRALEAN